MITIIVLLILAGVTIAALTGSDSAPAKANEAKQKQDIGAAKDEVYLTAQNAQTEAYERVYVDGKQVGTDAAVTAGDASTNVGSYVISKLKEKYDANPEVGLATVTVSDDGKIIISTTDFTEKGKINLEGGTLKWIEMAPTYIKVGNDTIDLSTLDEDTVGQYYGATVATINDIDYGLFYVDYTGKFGDKGTVYLKSLNSVGTTRLDRGVTENAEAIKIMKQLNPDWASHRGTEEFINYDMGERGAGDLCNPTVALWSGIQMAFEEEYGAEKVNYVIGGPSIELFMASYNAKVGPDPAYTTRWFAAREKYEYKGYLYSIDNGTNYKEYTEYGAIPTADGMYRNSSYSYWMASPISYFMYGGWVGFVSGGGNFLGKLDIYTNLEVTPLVSLKQGVNLAQ